MAEYDVLEDLIKSGFVRLVDGVPVNFQATDGAIQEEFSTDPDI